MSKPKDKSVTDSATPAATPIALLGSSVLPAEIDLGNGKTITLGDLVATAHGATQMSVEDWNAMSEEQRAEILATAVEAARAQAAGAGAGVNGTKPGDDKQKTKKIKALRITARRPGFRRAGHAWPATPTDVPKSELSLSQVAALRGELMLTVEDVEIEA